MEDLTKMQQMVGAAIKSLYQMILLISRKDGSCRVIDYNTEIRNISSDIGSFPLFCRYLFMNVHPEDRESFREFTDPGYYVENLSEKVYLSVECRVRHTDMNYYWSEIILCNASREDSTGGDDLLFLIRDIHDRKVRELIREAGERTVFKDLQDRYDALFEENMKDQQTGCYNRKGMKYYTDVVLKEAYETGKDLFVCVTDLNGLKYLNDTYGHAAGDEAIAAVSSELLKSAPGGSRIVRTGGDEFVLFAALERDSREPEEMSERIDRGLKRYNEEHSNPYTIGASYGWVLMPFKEGMVDLDEYIALADEKMYEMKLLRDEHRREKE